MSSHEPSFVVFLWFPLHTNCSKTWEIVAFDKKDFTAHVWSRILRHSRFSFHGLDLKYGGLYQPGLWNRIYRDTSLKMGPKFDGNCKRGLPAHSKQMIYSIYALSSSQTWSAS